MTCAVADERKVDCVQLGSVVCETDPIKAKQMHEALRKNRKCYSPLLLPFAKLGSSSRLLRPPTWSPRNPYRSAGSGTPFPAARAEDRGWAAPVRRGPRIRLDAVEPRGHVGNESNVRRVVPILW